VIRYRLTTAIDPMTAASFAHPLLTRFVGCGPVRVSQGTDGTVLEFGAPSASPSTWGPWRPCPRVPGMEFQLPDPLTPLDLSAYVKPHQRGELVTLACGLTVVVKPATSDYALTLDDLDDGPATEYARLAETVYERLTRDDVPLNDPQLRDLCFAAVRSGTKLTDELISAHRLIARSDCEALVRAAAGLPKAEPGAGDSPSSLPGSMQHA
jgi:hypothetical protein